MSLQIKNFGEINLHKLLIHCEGKTSVQLIDAGMIREKTEVYDFKLNPDNNNTIILNSKNKKQTHSIKIPVRIPISLELLIFFGMYDGDGNKTGNIGFAQNNIKLQTFVMNGIEKIFPRSFKSNVNILESTKFFDLPEIAQEVENIKSINEKNKNISITHKEAQKEYLLREFHMMDLKIGKIQNINITISPKKGGEILGKRSYEIIIEKIGSRSYLTLLLYVIKETIDSVLKLKQVPWIYWQIEPLKGSLQFIDIETYLSSNRCEYPNVRGEKNKYLITQNTESFIGISKKQQNTEVKILRNLHITPLLCLFFGIYWAEGTTTKRKLFTFRKIRESNLAIGFNSSEDKSLLLFFEAISQIFFDLDEIISCWLVKIGAKYHAEISALGSKLGVPVTRGGPGGDGIARTVEITKSARDWAIKQFPTMAKWEKYFDHIEFTGAGIPRVDVRCRATAALFFFSLMVDITFHEKEILIYLVEFNKNSNSYG